MSSEQRESVVTIMNLNVIFAYDHEAVLTKNPPELEEGICARAMEKNLPANK